MSKPRTKPEPIHAEHEPVRRKLAAELRKLATETRFTKSKRVEFARMAEQWEKTFQKSIIINLDVNQG